MRILKIINQGGKSIKGLIINKKCSHYLKFRLINLFHEI